MGAIDRLLRKWGFVKLADYGLLLTPEDRILATRAGALDDGTGGRVVGWKSSDLAWSELEAWTPGVARKPREFVPPLALASPRPAPRHEPGPEPAQHAPNPILAIAAAPPPEESDDDEWAWNVAAARAHAQARNAQDDWAVPRPIPPAAPEAAARPIDSGRQTVIPVPSMPRVTDPNVMRSSLRPSSPPRQVPRATLPPAPSRIGLPAQRRVAAKTR